jgi:hypothetical protein
MFKVLSHLLGPPEIFFRGQIKREFLLVSVHWRFDVPRKLEHLQSHAVGVVTILLYDDLKRTRCEDVEGDIVDRKHGVLVSRDSDGYLSIAVGTDGAGESHSFRNVKWT